MKFVDHNGFHTYSGLTVSFLVHGAFIAALTLLPQIEPITLGNDKETVEINVESTPPSGLKVLPKVPTPLQKKVKAQAKLPTKTPAKPVIKPNAETVVIPKVLPEKSAPAVVAKESVVNPSDSLEVPPIEAIPENTLTTSHQEEDTEAIENDIFNELQALEKPLEIEPLPTNEQQTQEVTSNRKSHTWTDTQDGRLLKQATGNHPLHYPEKLRRKGITGTVILKYSVTESGRVTNMHVLKSSGYKAFDNEAAQTISNWKYKPGQGGKTTHPVTFRLIGPKPKAVSRLRRRSGSPRRTSTKQ